MIFLEQKKTKLRFSEQKLQKEQRGTKVFLEQKLQRNKGEQKSFAPLCSFVTFVLKKNFVLKNIKLQHIFVSTNLFLPRSAKAQFFDMSFYDNHLTTCVLIFPTNCVELTSCQLGNM
jgi:ABC-type bacteriocin/lantibiotic exporter with double-glycine peptidase domain